MSRTHKDSKNYKGRDRHISVRAVRRNPPDLRKLSRALIELAMAEAAAEAEAQAETEVSNQPVVPTAPDEAPDD